MVKKKFLVIGIVTFILVLIFIKISFVIAGWAHSSSITNGLSTTNSYISPSVFQMGSQYHLIYGYYFGDFYGFTWNGTSWKSNTTIKNGLPDLGYYSSPSIFNFSLARFHLISGESGGRFKGFTWNGTAWIKNSTINASLPDIGSSSSPSVFQMGSQWHIISGADDCKFKGFTWNGTGWTNNATINASLPCINSGVPSVFQMGSQWHLISGKNGGYFRGFTWNGTGWTNNATINASLPYVWNEDIPEVFQMGSQWHLISGKKSGQGVEGFQFDFITPKLTLISPLNKTYNISEVIFNITSIDNLRMDTCIYSLNGGTTNYTMTNLTATQWNATNSSMTQGSHTVTFYCNDTANNINYTSLIFYNNIPNVNINSPINKSYSSTTINFNVTATDDIGVSSCIYSLNGGTTNYTMTNLTATQWNATNSSMTQGSHTVTFYCNDTEGNINSGQKKVFLIDTIYPKISMVSPANNTNSSDSRLDIKYKYTELNCDNVTWNDNNGANTTLASCGTNITLPTWSLGKHNITIFMRDMANNLNKTYTSFVVDANAWYKNITINSSSLPIQTDLASTVFQMGSQFHLIAGDNAGNFKGFTWNGTGWTKNATINASLPTYISVSSPTVFNFSTTRFNLISGNSDGKFKGFTWNGTGWTKNATINTSLPDIGSWSAPRVFQMGTQWHLISGNSNGYLKGFTWNGTGWKSNATINASLPDIGNDVAPSIFTFENEYYMIVGEYTGYSKGFTWDGTAWERDSTFNESLPYIGLAVNPNVFYIGSRLNILMAKGSSASFQGFTFPNMINVDLISPANNTFTNNLSINLTTEASDNIGIKNITFNIYNITSGSLLNTTTINFGASVLTKTMGVIHTFVDGMYKWFTKVFDWAGNSDVSTNYTLTIDSIPPKITSPENAVLEYGGSMLYADFDATETNPDSWYINWADTFMINSEGILTEAFGETPPMANYITLGIYEINVSFNDTFGNINSTIYTVTSQDTTDPIVTIDSPINGTNSSNTGLDIEFTIDDYLCNNATWQDGTGPNTTLADCYTEITIPTWSEGNHNITIFVRDTSNNLGKAYVSFLIDTTGPVFTDFENQSLYDNQSLSYDINATDVSGLGVFYINWTTNFTINAITGLLTNSSPFSEGNYYINVSVNDTLGYITSDIMWINVTATDSEAPVITKITPTNTYNFSSGNNVYFNFNATDDSIIDTCQLWTNTTGTWEKNYTWVNPTGVINYTIPNIREGRFKWNIWCNDSKNNYNFSTSNYTFTIDETAPNMTISNTNGSTEPYGDLTTKINYTASDTHLKSCYYTLRNSAGALHNYPENTSIDCSATSISISSLYFGTFIVQFWAEDYSGNLDESSLTFITVGEGGAGGSSGGGGTSLSSNKNMVNLKFKMHYYNNGLEYIMDDIGQYYMPNMTYDAFSVEVIGENVGTDDLLLNLVNVTPKEFNSRMSRTPEYLKAYEEKSLWTSGVMLVKDFKSDEKYEFFINVASNNSNSIKYVNSTLFLDFSHERLEFPKFSILNVGNTVYEGKPLLGLAILIIVVFLLITLLYKKRR